MKHWSIDRLALSVPGFDESQARELAQCVARALATPGAAHTNSGRAEPTRPCRDRERIALELCACDGESMETLARRIVTALARAA